jgi:hypothetical protein
MEISRANAGRRRRCNLEGNKDNEEGHRGGTPRSDNEEEGDREVTPRRDNEE